MAYVKVEKIQKKLKQANKENDTLYIHGSVGMGKTAAVKHYLRRKPHLYFESDNGFYNELVDLTTVDEDTIVFDDISQISNVETEEYIVNAIANNPEKFFILIGRGRVPKWLEHTSVSRSFQYADNNDLQLSDDEIVELFAEKEINLTPESEEFANIVDYSDRNTLTMIYISNFYSSTGFLNDYVVSQAEQGMFQYLDHVFFDRLNRDMQDTLLSLCQFDEFNGELAEYILANRKVPALFDKMNQLGDFLINLGDDRYSIEKTYSKYLKWKQGIYFTKRQINENYERAAVYYEMNDQIVDALECYTQTRNYDKITSLLLKVAEENPEMENFKDYSKYFESIPLESINSQPVLMSSMSMMRSLMLDPEGSEMWYQRLEEFSSRARKGTVDYRDAMSRLYMLDILLPHRKLDNALENIASVNEMMRGFPEDSPQISIVDKAPSAIYGGKDFSDILLNARPQIDLIKEQATESTGFLGKDTVGFINAAELEWQFEHDEIDSYDLNTSLNKIYHDADSKDSMNMCYVATGLMIRDFIAHGKFASAEMFFNNFLEKVKSANNVDEELLKSLVAFRVRMELYKGNPNEASDWLDTTPNSMVFFSIQDRYIYVNKIRALIIFKRFEEALSLIERLLISFERYNRPYYNIQILILKAILLYREDDPRWRDILVDALKRAEKYGYMRIFSDEGFALKPLLDKIEAPGVDKAYYAKIKELTNDMSINYPNYMKTVELIQDPLTDMERKVTKMMCAELTSEEICDMLHISYSGLKFHKQNIYKKLGVSNRQEAQRKAKSLGLDLQ